MSELVNFLSQLIALFDLEKITLFGYRIDGLAHFLLGLIIPAIFIILKKVRLGFYLTFSLIWLKEFLDLGIIFYYNMPTKSQWIDSALDIFFGILGLSLAVVFVQRHKVGTAFNRAVKVTSDSNQDNR